MTHPIITSKRNCFSIVILASLFGVCCYSVVTFVLHKNTKSAVYKMGSEIKLAVYSGDGEFLAICDRDGQIDIRNSDSGQRVGKFQVKGNVSSLAFSPDNTVLALGSFDGDLYFWSIEDAQIIRHYHINPILCIRYSKQGLFGYSTSGLTAREENQFTIMHWKTRKVVKTWKMQGFDYRITSFNFSYSGNKVACTTATSKIILFDTHSKNFSWKIGWKIGQSLWGSGNGASIAFSPNDKYIITTLEPKPIGYLGLVINASDGSIHKKIKLKKLNVNIRRSLIYYSSNGSIRILGTNNDHDLLIINQEGKVINRYETNINVPLVPLDVSALTKQFAVAYGPKIGIWEIR